VTLYFSFWALSPQTRSSWTPLGDFHPRTPDSARYLQLSHQRKYPEKHWTIHTKNNT